MNLPGVQTIKDNWTYVTTGMIKLSETFPQRSSLSVALQTSALKTEIESNPLERISPLYNLVYQPIDKAFPATVQQVAEDEHIKEESMTSHVFKNMASLLLISYCGSAIAAANFVLAIFKGLQASAYQKTAANSKDHNISRSGEAEEQKKALETSKCALQHLFACGVTVIAGLTLSYATALPFVLKYGVLAAVVVQDTEKLSAFSKKIDAWGDSLIDSFLQERQKPSLLDKFKGLFSNKA